MIYMDKEWHELVWEMVGTNQDAGTWLLQAVDWSEHFDHLVDDGDIADIGAFKNRMHTILVEWPLNPFYRAHQATLGIVINNAWYSWTASDQFPETRCKAYDIATELFTTVAFLLGGRKLCNQYSSRARDWCVRKMKQNDRKD